MGARSLVAVLLLCTMPVSAQGRPVIRPRDTSVRTGRPVLERAQLGRAVFTPGDNLPTVGAADLRVYDQLPSVTLAWKSTSAAAGWRWQVADQPYNDLATLTPAGLLASGEVQGPSFRLDFSNFPPIGRRRLSQPSNAQRAGPMTLYVRIVPVGNGAVAGPPSNTVLVHYTPGERPPNVAGDSIAASVAAEAMKRKNTAILAAMYQVFDVQLLSFTPAVFPDPNKWGCVFLVANPLYGQASPIGGYKPGMEHCGQPYKGAGYHANSLWDYAGGWLFAYEGLVGVIDNVKVFVATKLSSAVPCDLLPKSAAEDCKSATQSVALAALSAGIAAAGVPPSLPSLAALQDMARGEIAAAAVEFTCAEVAKQGGECSESRRILLEQAFRAGLDQLQQQLTTSGSEPGCGNAEEAHKNGREMLPCFSGYPGVVVKPAAGTEYVPPHAVVRVTRLRPDPAAGTPACQLQLSMLVNNDFTGGNLSGIQVKPTSMMGYPFGSVKAGVPVISVGQSTDVTLVMSTVNPFVVPGHLVKPSKGWSQDWLALYHGGSAQVSVGLATTPPSATGSVSCAAKSGQLNAVLP